MKIGGVYILSRRSIARMLATITAALKGNRTRRMVDQLDDFKAWLLGNPVNERDSTKTVGARAAARIPSIQRHRELKTGNSWCFQ